MLSHPFSMAAQMKHCCFMTTLLSAHNTDGWAVSWTLSGLCMQPYRHDCLSVFPQAGQVLSGPK